MDRRLALLLEFYRGLPKDRAKVETRYHGFAFLEGLLADGATLEYGELTLSGLLHKYKLANLSAGRMRQLLRAHIDKEFNVCLYFDDRANSLFCFNLDNNHKVDSTALIPEVVAAVGFLDATLRDLGCVPLVLASGRGYHLWVRLASAVENDRLYGLMIRVAAKTAAALQSRGLDPTRIKLNLYPDRRIRDIVSLRLFGTEHAKNHVFSHVWTPEGLLDEQASWGAFEEHFRCNTLALDGFKQAYSTLLAAIP
jgi:hypothetical protein